MWYHTYKLIDSVRTERGPRQREILNLGVDFSILSLDCVYKVSDRPLKHKDALEEHLRRIEDQLFALEEKIILYDPTNTFFEGSGKYNPKARYGGNSKEKRSDCPGCGDRYGRKCPMAERQPLSLYRGFSEEKERNTI